MKRGKGNYSTFKLKKTEPIFLNKYFFDYSMKKEIKWRMM